MGEGERGVEGGGREREGRKGGEKESETDRVNPS